MKMRWVPMMQRRPKNPLRSISYSGGTVVPLEDKTPQSKTNPWRRSALGLLHATLLIGIGEGCTEVLVEALLCRLVTIRWVLWQVLLGRAVVLSASVEVVDLSILRVLVLGVVVAVSFTLLVLATDDVSAFEVLVEIV